MVNRPIRILQYGEGNFLRAFVDYMVDVANERGLFDGDIAIVKPIPHGSLDAFRRQNCRYTVCLRGIQDGEAVDERRTITCIQTGLDTYTDYDAYMALAKLPELEFVVSNTTEAGIAFDPACRADETPPTAFPAKLTQFLYRRYRHFGGDPGGGLVMLPVELIENNGQKLRDCVLQYIALWRLEPGFLNWVENACSFHSTLVDRIVTGYPRKGAAELLAALDFDDSLLTVAEPFGLWVIEGGAELSSRLPLDKAGQPAVFTRDVRPYRERKVRILNGAHTATVLAGYLCGLDTVGECIADPLVRNYMERTVLEEIVPGVPMPRGEAEAFARSVFERFENPFMRHECLSIALNSISKWRTRVLPSFKDYLAAEKTLPVRLTFSLAALLAFYTTVGEAGGLAAGSRDGIPYPLHDNAAVLDFFCAHSTRPAADYAAAALSRVDFWGEDLTMLPGLLAAVRTHLEVICASGMRAAMEALDG